MRRGQRRLIASGEAASAASDDKTTVLACCLSVYRHDRQGYKRRVRPATLAITDVRPDQTALQSRNAPARPVLDSPATAAYPQIAAVPGGCPRRQSRANCGRTRQYQAPFL